MKIKTGFLISYDWILLKTSLPLIYNESDIIYLAIDKNRMTWNGNYFELPNDFYEFVNNIDIYKKVFIYEDDFYEPDLSPIDNETRERNMLSQKMGIEGWHIQIDVDEYFIDFKGFTNCLKKISTKNKLNIYCDSVFLYKRNENGFFVVRNNNNKYSDLIPIATNYPFFELARRNSNFSFIIYSYIIHDSWARSEEELYLKLNNWGHSKNYFNVEEYYNFWKKLNWNNYKEYKNFHPLDGKKWEELDYIESNSIKDLTVYLKRTNKFQTKITLIDRMRWMIVSSKFLLKLLISIKSKLHR